MPKLVRGELSLSENSDVALIQYEMLLKNYIYRARVNKDGTFEAIVLNSLDNDPVELIKNDFPVKKIEEIREVKIEV